jgi:bifunctional DNase/RNase
VPGVQSALHRARRTLAAHAGPIRVKEDTMTEVHIGSIYATTWTSEEGAESTSATIDFRGRDDATALWIVWGRAEADAAVASLESRELPRPATHDLAQTLIEALGGRLQSVEINKLVDSTFYATLRIQQDERLIEVDSRPSDVVNLALRADVAISVADEVVREARRQWETHPRPPEVGYEFAGKTVRAVERIWPPVSDSDS